jgi:hypothetical protein
MFMNPLSNIANPYIQSLTNAAMSVLNSFGATAGAAKSSGSSTIPQDSSPQLSPFAQLMSTLQQLQQSNPAQYANVTQQIATNLQSASQTALANGNTGEAQQLSTLSNDFKTASTSDQLPNISDLAEAMGGHHHHHHYSSGGSSSSSASHSSATSTASMNSQSPQATVSSIMQSLSQLFGDFANNASRSQSQGQSLNPMNIIMNTLQNDGIQVGN